MKTIQSWQQYRVKADMGLWHGCSVKYKWHWKFWKPMRNGIDTIWFGPYVIVDMPDEIAESKW
jgi:hypothetical protein